MGTAILSPLFDVAGAFDFVAPAPYDFVTDSNDNGAFAYVQESVVSSYAPANVEVETIATSSWFSPTHLPRHSGSAGGGSGTPSTPAASNRGDAPSKSGQLTPDQAIEYLSDHILKGAKTDEIENRILVHTARMGSEVNELKYLEGAAHTIAHIHQAYGRINTERFLPILFMIGRLFHDSTDFVKASEIEREIDFNIGEAASLILIHAGSFERAMDDENVRSDKPIAPDNAEQIAYLQILGAIKGVNYFALKDRDARVNNYELIVAKVLMMMRDCQARFRNLGAEEKARNVDYLMGQVKAAHKVTGDEIEWSKMAISRYIRKRVSELSKYRASPDALTKLGAIYFNDLADIAVGNIMFSPWIFRKSASVLNEYRLNDLAAEHIITANTETWMAERLGLKD